jgi:prevent-host-death family protein
MNVSIRDLKAKLSRYLREASSGQDVVVTSRGRPVVRLLPVSADAAEKPSGEELLRRLNLVPNVRPGTGGKPLGAKHPIRVRPGQKSLADIVLEDRG